MFRLELVRGNVKDLGRIAAFLEASSQQLHLSERVLYHLQLAVDEACSNIFEHAYGGRDGRVEIELESQQGSLIARIRDWGDPFDPSDIPAPDPTRPLEEWPIGGLGLHLIHTLMDEVSYRFDSRAGNCLTLQKRLDG